MSSCRFLFRTASVRPHSTSILRRRLSYRVAIVGSGPAGCYTAKYLQSSLEKKGISNNTIDILDKHATIGGLVRFGVAPDHPEVKNVLNDFEKLFEEKGINFYGNVHVGKDVSVQELRELYDVVVLAYGCESDRRLGIPGEDLEGVVSAREFVAWYNGHPDYVHIGEKVASALGGSGDSGIRQATVVVIGQGNVALDCARILVKGGTGLFDTDLAAHALPILGGGVRDVRIVGRRGHIQGAFTIKELRELVHLQKDGFDTTFAVRTDELRLGTTDASIAELEAPGGRPKQRIDQLLKSASEEKHNGVAAKTVSIRFLLNPKEFRADKSDPTRLGAVVCERTKLEGEAGKQRAVGTGTLEEIPAQLSLVSIGYKGVALAGLETVFDERHGVLTNVRGRVESPSSEAGGLYTSGWLKRGPSGIIGTNIADAKDTVATVLQDLSGHKPYDGTRSTLKELLLSKCVQVVDWAGYRKIVAAEKKRTRSAAQPREKITDKRIQMDIAGGAEI